MRSSPHISPIFICQNSSQPDIKFDSFARFDGFRYTTQDGEHKFYSPISFFTFSQQLALKNDDDSGWAPGSISLLLNLRIKQKDCYKYSYLQKL